MTLRKMAQILLPFHPYAGTWKEIQNAFRTIRIVGSLSDSTGDKVEEAADNTDLETLEEAGDTIEQKTDDM